MDFFFFYAKPVRGGPLSRSCRHFALGSLHRLCNIILYRVIVSDMIPSERIYYNIVILYTVTTVLSLRSRRSNGYLAIRDHRPAEYSSDEVMHENNILCWYSVIILLYLSLNTPRISSGLIKWHSIQHLYGPIYIWRFRFLARAIRYYITLYIVVLITFWRLVRAPPIVLFSISNHFCFSVPDLNPRVLSLN